MLIILRLEIWKIFVKKIRTFYRISIILELITEEEKCNLNSCGLEYKFRTIFCSKQKLRTLLRISFILLHKAISSHLFNDVWTKFVYACWYMVNFRPTESKNNIQYLGVCNTFGDLFARLYQIIDQKYATMLSVLIFIRTSMINVWVQTSDSNTFSQHFLLTLVIIARPPAAAKAVCRSFDWHKYTKHLILSFSASNLFTTSVCLIKLTKHSTDALTNISWSS